MLAGDRWLTSLSSTTSSRAVPAAGRCTDSRATEGLRPAPSSAARCPPHPLESVSCSCDWRTGLVRHAPRPRRSAGLVIASPPDVSNTMGGAACGSALISPGQVQAVHVRHVHVEHREVVGGRARPPAPDSASASAASSAWSACIPHASHLAFEDEPVGGVVVDDEHAEPG